MDARHHTLTRRFLKLTVSVLVPSIALTACAGAEALKSDDSTAIVYTIRENQPVFDLSVPELDRHLEAVLGGGGDVTVISADSKPSSIDSIDLSYDEDNSTEVDRAKAENRFALEEAFSNAVADDPEADPLEALSRAAAAVRGSTGEQLILMIDSGLGTSGPMSLLSGLLYSDPELAATYLADAGALPNLEGIRILWYGMGDTSGRQDPLATADRSRLEALWTTVIARAGGALELITAPSIARDYDTSVLPPVTPVALQPISPPDTPSITVTFQEGQIAFIPESSEFAQEAAAKQVLASLASTIVENRLTKVSITGTTASLKNPEGERDLSLKRATAVRDVLLSLGVPEDWIIAVEGLGAGPHDNWPGGVWDGDAAYLNRQVTVTATQ